MAQTYGKSDSSLIDRQLTISSVFAPYFGDNGYKFNNDGSIRVFSLDNGTLAGYNENSVVYSPVTLVGNSGNDYTLAYNQAMFARIQKTLEQDTPIADLAAQWARQQIEEVFIPTHDVYSINKVVAARENGQAVRIAAVNNTVRLPLAFAKAVMKVKNKGGQVQRMVALVSSTYAAELADQINFTGSDAGYGDGINKSFLGRLKGVTCVEVPDHYFPQALGTKPQGGTGDWGQVHVLVADKKAILNVTPKMRPDDYTVITKVPGFSGSEVQLRDRGDTFVLVKKAGAIATVEQGADVGTSSASTTNTHAPTTGTSKAATTAL